MINFAKLSRSLVRSFEFTIQNPEQYVNNLWDWGILNGCFGDTKIQPTDIDGFVERHGYFLVMETKAPGVPLKDGQLYTFRELLKLNKFTIIVIWGKPGKPEKIKVFTRRNRDGIEMNASIEVLRKVVSDWFTYAEGTKKF